MLEQASIPDTDDWWVMQLAAEWGRGLPALHELRSHIDGTAILPAGIDANQAHAFRQFVKMHRLNPAELIVDARVNRMKPLGFRTAAPGDDTGDDLALANWKRSNMKVGFRDLVWNASVYGRAYTITTGPAVPSPAAEPLIVPRTPWEVIVRRNAARPWIVDVSMTLGHDPVLQVDILTLYRNGYMRQAYRKAKVTSLPDNGSPWLPGRGWSWASDPIPLGYTDTSPVVELRLKNGKGVYEAHTDTLDRINKTILDRSLIMAMQAFRQRALEGKLPQVYPAGHPRAGEAIDYNEVFKSGPDQLWILGDAKIWESAQADITPILTATKDDMRHLAAVTSTPLYVLQPDAANGSAEGASLAREGLVFAVEEMIDRADVAIAQAQSLAFRALGDDVRAAVGEIETIWAAVDRTSLTQRAAAAAQAKQAGLSRRMTQEKIWQMTPAEIRQERQNLSDEQFEEPLPVGA